MIKIVANLLSRIIAPFSQKGFKISAGGERGLSYYDNTGLYLIDAMFIETGVRQRYEFTSKDIFAVDESKSVETKYSEVGAEKAKQIEQHVRQWLEDRNLS
jgi:hypothetical protein